MAPTCPTLVASSLRAPAASAFRRAAPQAHGRWASAVCHATHKFTVLPGDGIGPEIMAVALKVLTAAGEAEGEEFVYTEAHIGGAAIDATGDPYPAETEAACKAADAVLLSAIGGWVRAGAGLRLRLQYLACLCSLPPQLFTGRD